MTVPMPLPKHSTMSLRGAALIQATTSTGESLSAPKGKRPNSKQAGFKIIGGRSTILLMCIPALPPPPKPLVKVAFAVIEGSEFRPRLDNSILHPGVWT